MNEKVVDIATLLCCPRCRSELDRSSSYRCSNSSCSYTIEGFPTANGQPVLIDFEHSVFERHAYRDGQGSVLSREHTGGIKAKLRRVTSSRNSVAAAKCSEMLKRLRGTTANPIVLVIGGGDIGIGAEGLYESGAQIVGTDVYASVHTQVVADGHRLPFNSASFDGVWIQAVLEHVLEPQVVVEEIHRVLKPGGLVYADTPFMVPVHEAAYDFTRFSQSGHRWLFRRFAQIDAGVVTGAGTATLWSIQYLARALGAGYTTSSLIALPFFWLKYLDRFAERRKNADAAHATFFFGSKSHTSLSPKDMAAYYEDQAR